MSADNVFSAHRFAAHIEYANGDKRVIPYDGRHTDGAHLVFIQRPGVCILVNALSVRSVDLVEAADCVGRA